MKDFVIFLLALVFITVVGANFMNWYESQLSAKDLIGTYNITEVGMVGLPPMKLERGQYKMFINGTNEPNKLFISTQKSEQRRPDPFEEATFDGEYLVHTKANAIIQVTVVKGVGYKLFWVKKNQYGILEKE